ncbi:UNVERIFIED_CONTAM: hypothetical protein K2H54_040897 [Gekko kuhli]
MLSENFLPPVCGVEKRGLSSGWRALLILSGVEKTGPEVLYQCINPYKTVQKSTYPPPDGYSKDYEDTNSFEELFGQQYHPSTGNEDKYERYQYSQKDDDFSKDIHRDKLYLQFYQQIEKEFDKDRPSDCVIVSISKDQA